MTASKAAELMRRAGADLSAPKSTSTAIVLAGDEDEEWAEGDGEWDEVGQGAQGALAVTAPGGWRLELR